MNEPPDPAIIEAAAAMHAIDCGCTDYGREPDGDEDLYYLRLAEAAAPTLYQHGRQEAAEAILNDPGLPIYLNQPDDTHQHDDPLLTRSHAAQLATGP